ncbi:MAG: DUF6993 domain-containing protein [Microbacterium sp.]|uniref:DUF6993 domain-containing protein n=1 Tax=Microbacterium sp. TaxID=51671 RepID=UPI003A8918D5
MPTPRSLRVAAILVSAVVLAGCVAGEDPTPSVPASGTATVAPTASPTASPEPELHPEGTAADNLPLFTAVTRRVWASGDAESGRAYVDALVTAGFEKSAMQVTADRSTIGNTAESLQFSVRWGEDCLVGQVGESTGEPVTVILPALSDGSCLIGQTRPIDW